MKVMVGDFETTVYKGQEDTEVWASACVELFSEDVKIFHSISEQFEYFKSLDCNIVCYYHNLKFDGAFWMSYLLVDLGFKQSYIQDEETITWTTKKQMPNNTVLYSISGMGLWYKIIFKVAGRFIELRDSYKLLPFSVKRIGQSFQTKHKKLDMKYEGFRYAGCEITEEEKQYIANDVLVVKEALEIMYNEGHNKLTIGACCLSEFKNIIGKYKFNDYMPDLSEIELDFEEYGASNADEWIRKSYKGGWCYLVKGKENKIFKNGFTADVNSLYPSMMSSESLNLFPIGRPTFWHGNYIPQEALINNRYYFIKFRCKFYLKENKLPFVQIKNSLLYNSTEMLECSDIYNKRDDSYYSYYKDFDGEIKEAKPTLTMTMTDFELFREHYDAFDFEILSGCYFETQIGIFDGYIDKYKKIKMESKGAKRELAKLFLNNLYGKMATSSNSNFKVAYEKEDKTISFFTVIENNKKVGYIPIGSAITSYARNFTIRAAQANYYGADKAGFIYADTDSIHCDIPIEQAKGIVEHDKNFCCWKIESYWDEAIFVRPKTYIEHVTHENKEPIEKPFYSVKCAGMPDKCKQLFLESMGELHQEEHTEEEIEFLKTKRTLKDFKIGLTVPSKLLPKRIRGGIILTPTTYQMR